VLRQKPLKHMELPPQPVHKSSTEDTLRPPVMCSNHPSSKAESGVGRFYFALPKGRN
jgi:hypothetical protein